MLLEEFKQRYTKPPRVLSKKILFTTFGNLLWRSGFDLLWGGMTDNTKEEILQTNLQSIERIIKSSNI